MLSKLLAIVVSRYTQICHRGEMRGRLRSAFTKPGKKYLLVAAAEMKYYGMMYCGPATQIKVESSREALSISRRLIQACCEGIPNEGSVICSIHLVRENGVEDIEFAGNLFTDDIPYPIGYMQWLKHFG